MQQLFTVFSCQGLFFGKLKKNGESVKVQILAGDPRHCQVLWYLWLLVGGGDAVCIHMSTYARLPCLRCLCDRAVLFPFNHHPTSNWQLSQQKLFWGRHQHFITISSPLRLIHSGTQNEAFLSHPEQIKKRTSESSGRRWSGERFRILS